MPRCASTESRPNPPVTRARALSAAAILVALAAAQVTLAGDEAAGAESLRQRMFQVGMTYGLLSTAAWITTAITAQSLRVAIIAGGVTLSAIWLANTRGPDRFQQDMLRYLSIGCGLVLSQGVGFYLLGVPRWRRASAEVAGRGRGHFREHQYGIAQVMTATTMMAVLLALARRYAPPIDPLAYWLGMAAIWLWLPLLSGLIAHAALRGAAAPAAGWAVAALGIGGAGAAGLAVLELRLGEQPPEQWQPLLSAYLTFAATHAAVVAVVARSGR